MCRNATDAPTAKEKIDGIKRSLRKTGGGPPSGPSLTPSEEALMKSLEGRPVSIGLPAGIDTDDIPCTYASLSPPTYEEENKETNSERLSVPQCSDRRTEEQKTTKTKQKKAKKISHI
ncbi:uncharacterized protein [Magallana gigas]|uniref:uncharacterized protein n=1 Tax=Magallana gigas TaxID=29159 RepID=UPI003340B0F7